jgi:uncharacterized membrane protein
MSLLFDIMFLARRKGQYEALGWACQVTSIVGLVAAIVSGLHARSQLPEVGPWTAFLDLHQQFALLVISTQLILTIWRLKWRGKIPSRSITYVGLHAVATAGIWVVAWYGGVLVYDFGLGVNKEL